MHCLKRKFKVMFWFIDSNVFLIVNKLYLIDKIKVEEVRQLVDIVDIVPNLESGRHEFKSCLRYSLDVWL